MPSTPRSPAQPRSSCRPARENGQAALEYAGVLAVVVGVLVLAAGVGGGGAGGLSNGVLRGMERALCVVTGGSCSTTRLEACTVRSRETGGRLGVQITLVRLGRGLSLLREEHSDGTVDLTLVDAGEVAPTAAIGAEGGIRLGGDRVGGGAISEAELLVRLGRRRVWHQPDAASADRLARRIREHVAVEVATHLGPAGLGQGVKGVAHVLGYHGDRLPPPDVDALSAGVEGAVEAGFGVGGKVKAGFRASLGGTLDRHTGERSFVFALEGEASATLLAGNGVSGSGSATIQAKYDRSGEPIELSVTVAGTATARLGAELPAAARRVGRSSGDRIEVTARLPLQAPAARAAFDGLLAALAPAGGRALPAATLALAEQFRASARIDVTRYASRATAYGADGEVALGGRLGGSLEVTQSSSELRDAWTRPAGGVWERRTDCLRPTGRL